tara:strand:+ start:485 stop:604 length:120 start_codon:yes stop_codon:yes gene_type:complete
MAALQERRAAVAVNHQQVALCLLDKQRRVLVAMELIGIV